MIKINVDSWRGKLQFISPHLPRYIYYFTQTLTHLTDGEIKRNSKRIQIQAAQNCSETWDLGNMENISMIYIAFVSYKLLFDIIQKALCQLKMIFSPRQHKEISLYCMVFPVLTNCIIIIVTYGIY